MYSIIKEKNMRNEKWLTHGLKVEERDYIKDGDDL